MALGMLAAMLFGKPRIHTTHVAEVTAIHFCFLIPHWRGMTDPQPNRR